MNQGDILYVKTSEEPVIVLHCGLTPDSPLTAISVRRPVMTSEGTAYVEAEFYRFELETVEEQILRKLEALKLQHVLSQKAAKEVPQQIDLFGAVPEGALRN